MSDACLVIVLIDAWLSEIVLMTFPEIFLSLMLHTLIHTFVKKTAAII